MKTDKQSPEAAYQTLLVVWVALLFSQLMFPALIYFIKPELYNLDFSTPILGDNPVVVIILALAALSSAILSLSLKGKYLSRSVADQDIAMVQTSLIVGCALCETASLIGVTLALAFQYQYFFVFIVVGIIGTGLHFPTRASIHAASYKSK